MNDGKIIIDKIIAEAEAQAKVIIAEGQKEANAILKAANAKLEREREVADRDAQLEAAKASAKEISAAQTKAGKAVLEEKQRILAEIIADAEKTLKTLPEDEYKKVVGKMLDGIAKEPNMEVIVAKKDRECLTLPIRDRGFKLAMESRDIDGGFIIKCGDIEYNYTFESIIQVEKEAIQQLAAKILF